MHSLWLQLDNQASKRQLTGDVIHNSNTVMDTMQNWDPQI